MQFTIKRDLLLKSLSFVQGIVEKKNPLRLESIVVVKFKVKKKKFLEPILDLEFLDEI